MNKAVATAVFGDDKKVKNLHKQMPAKERPKIFGKLYYESNLSKYEPHPE